MPLGILCASPRYRHARLCQCGGALNLSLASRGTVDSINEVARTEGGLAHVNPVQNLGFMCSRNLADPDGHLLGGILDESRGGHPTGLRTRQRELAGCSPGAGRAPVWS